MGILESLHSCKQEEGIFLSWMLISIICLSLLLRSVLERCSANLEPTGPNSFGVSLQRRKTLMNANDALSLTSPTPPSRPRYPTEFEDGSSFERIRGCAPKEAIKREETSDKHKRFHRYKVLSGSLSLSLSLDDSAGENMTLFCLSAFVPLMVMF